MVEEWGGTRLSKLGREEKLLKEVILMGVWMMKEHCQVKKWAILGTRGIVC